MKGKIVAVRIPLNAKIILIKSSPVKAIITAFMA
jgi:hypothetical protein